MRCELHPYRLCRDDGLLHKIVRELGVYPRSADYDDALQEARIQFILAERAFNPAVGVPWSNYLAITVRRALWRWLTVKRRNGLTRVGDRKCRWDEVPKTTSFDGNRENMPEPESRPDDTLDRAEERERVRLLVSKMPPRMKRICRRYMKGDSFRTIGARIGMSHEMVRKIIQGCRYRFE